MDLNQIVGNVETEDGEHINPDSIKISKRQLLIVGTFLIGVVICVFCTIKFSWKSSKIASFFLFLSILTGVMSGFDMNEIAKKIIRGCGPMVNASFVVGIASAVSLILKNGKILDTIVNWLSMPLGSLGAVAGAGFMVYVNALINILIPSGSGQAAVVMPLMTPIGDIIGITRQVSVQAFQFGDGLTNLITPLNGTLMGGLAMVHVQFPRYFKFAIKVIGTQVIIASIITMYLQYIGWTGL